MAEAEPREDEQRAIERQVDARTTELRDALAVAERGHQELKSLIDVAEVMAFEYSVPAGRLTWADPQRRARLLGVDLDGLSLDDYLRRFVVEDDRAGLSQGFERLLRSPGCTMLKHEYRVRCPMVARAACASP